MRRHSDKVQNSKGEVLEGASVAVYGAGTTTLATIYSDEGVTSIDNPILTDACGRFTFYVADGLYDLAVSGEGITAHTEEDVPIRDLFDSSVEAGETIRVEDIEATGDIGCASGTLTALNVIAQDGEFEAITATTRVVTSRVYIGSGVTDVFIDSGTGTPEGSVAAPVGALYTDDAGGAGATLYVKESGTGDTGWAAK